MKSFTQEQEKLAKRTKARKALIIVDVQNDFCEGGALAVPKGNEVIPEINALQNSDDYTLIVATLDFHPHNHKSFASNNNAPVGSLGELNGQPQVMWPNHCVEGTKGADLHKDLETLRIGKVFRKGRNPEVDSYSGFFDNDKKSETGLGQFLKDKGIDEVHVVGLALDYCVKATALDAKQLGFETVVIEKGTRAVNLSPDDGNNSLKELKAAGIIVA